MIVHLMDILRAAWKPLWTYALAHKILATIGAVIFLYAGYTVYSTLTAPGTTTRYITTTVATGTVVATVTETGQVSASHQISLSPQASGQVVGIYVKPGDHVYAGQTIAQLDATNALQALESAKLSLQNAELSYTQTTASSTLTLNLIVAKNGLTNSQIALQKAHDDAYASIANIYSDLSTIVTGLDGVLHNSSVAGRLTQQNIDAYTDLVSLHDDSISIYKNSAQTSYTNAFTAYSSGLALYKATSNTISNDDLIALAKATYITVQTVADAVRNSHDFFDRVTSDYSLYNYTPSPTLAGLLASTNTYTATVGTDLGNALVGQSSITSAEQALAQATNTLKTTEGGSNTLTVQSAMLSLQQAQNTVTNAEIALANYTVTAPFSGNIASVGVQKYDQATSGTSVAVLVTSQETATISVNEVDASKIKLGQKATLSFDALPNVSIAGTVASINSVGAASQGVVSYTILVGFDTPNTSILPGMSVTANIITGTETGLIVPTSAIKTSGSQSSVQVLDVPIAANASSATQLVTPLPTQVIVTLGLNDTTNTIIERGLTSGAQIVTQTITGAATKTTTSAPSILNAAGARGGARSGGAFRALGG